MKRNNQKFLIILLSIIAIILCSLITSSKIIIDSNDINKNIKDTEYYDFKVEAYLKIIKNIYNTDAALNSDITMMSIVIDDDKISPKQKEKIFKTLRNTYGYEIIEKDYILLKQDGYLSDDQFYFKEGVLITIDNIHETQDGFKYDVNKWRSGLGAVGMNENEIRNDNGNLVIKFGQMYMS